MPDREKVIKGLECCTFILGKRKCDECPYAKGPDCYSLMPDTKALLKAQEPKPPIIKKNSYGWKFYYCPSCGNEFYQNNKFSFCEKCGQAVRWE